MNTPMEKGKQEDTFSRPASTSETTEGRGNLPGTVSAAALRIGLAHLIHEITNRLQLVYDAFCLLETDMTAVNAGRDSFVGEMFNGGKCAVEELISLIASLRTQVEILLETDPPFEALDLSSLVEAILRRETPRFDARAICLVKDMVTDLPLIQANRNLLEVALRNLITNASDAMPKGGKLTVVTGARDRLVYLEVTDTGVGIPPQVDVFQPFATSKSEGMGLGLAIVRHIVQVHGGTITYKSRPDKGTTFCLTLPAEVDKKHRPARGEAAIFAHP